MAKRGGRNRSRGQSPNYGRLRRHTGVHWQSAELNDETYEYYRNIMMQLAMSRFKWVNLPASCDARFLEWQLLCEGVATIAFPAKARGEFLSLRAALRGPVTMYGNASEWLGVGDNGTRIRCNPDNGVLVWDNDSRYPLMSGIDLYANELTHIRMAKRVNRLHLQMPFLLVGPQEKQQEMTNLYSKIVGGEPVVIGTSGMSTIEVSAIQTGVKFYGAELAADEANVWNRVYTMLGMQNSTFKQERQTEDEIRAQSQPSGILRLNSLASRREAARLMNERFGDYLDAEIQVIWNEDWESENANLAMNLQHQLDILEQ